MRGRKNARIKVIAGVLCLLVLFSSFLSLPASAEEVAMPDLSRANAVLLYQLENSHLLASQNADRPIFPASTVQIMTGLLAVESLQGRYAETMTVTQEMVNAASGFRMYLNPGETVTMEQMLYAAICAGYNDACVMLAYAVSGSVEAFVMQMNARAAELGMTSTVYTNPTGLHQDRMVTTANDLAKLALVAMENEAYMEIVSTVKYTMDANSIAPARTFYNRNALIARNTTSRYYNADVTGLNAGTTTEGGYCVIASAQRGDLRYLCIVMGAEEDPPELGGTVYSYQLANELLDYAIRGFGMMRILDPQRVLATVRVALTEDRHELALVAQESVDAYLPKDADTSTLQYRVMLNDTEIKAPVEAGEVLGFVTVTYDDILLATVNLCAAERVERSPFLAGLDRISVYTSSRPFLLSCGYAVVLLLGYFVLLPYLRKRRNRKRAKYF